MSETAISDQITPFVHPDKLTSELAKASVLDALKIDWNIYKAAQRCGIARRLVYEWLEADHDFKRAFNEVRDGHLDGCESNLLMEGSQNKKAWVPAIFMLKSHRPEVYADRHETTLNINHSIGLSGRAKATLESMGVIEVEEAISVPEIESRPMVLPKSIEDNGLTNGIDKAQAEAEPK